MAVRKNTSWLWNPSGPISRHHERYLGCHSTRARCSLLSPPRFTLLGIFSLVKTSDMGLRPPEVEFGPFGFTVPRESSRRPHGVGTLEDPVLPRRKPAEDLRFHRLGTAEA